MTDKETLAVYDARAREYADNFCTDQDADPQLQSFLDALPNGADLLDLGCGPGRSAAIMAAAGHKVMATDASAEMVKLAGEHPGVTAHQARFDDLDGHEIYDGIWANFSLLHADRADLPGLITTIASALRSKGVFHIGMKTGAGASRDPIGRLYTYVTEEELLDWLSGNQLTVFARWSGSATGLAGTDDPYIILQARKNA